MRLGEEDKGQSRKAWWLARSANILKLMSPPPPVGDFVFRIVTTTPNETFTLPLGTSDLYIQDFTVYWDDTTSDIITSYDDAHKTHLYTSAGTYDIRISGSCQYFGFNNIGDRLKLTHLVSLTDVGFLAFNCWGCRNLLSIDNSFSNWSRLLTFADGFHDCYQLTVIPTGLFDNCTEIASFHGSFEEDYNISTIPAGLFDYCTKATNFSHCFFVNDLTSIPSTLFDNNPLVTTFEYCFASGWVMTSIPSGLFDHNPLVANFEWCFADCIELTSVPAGLFDNCVNAKTFEYCFAYNDKLVSLPTNLFSYCTKATSFRQCFFSDDGITTIPSGMFDNCSSVLTISRCFSGCGITSIPAGLFDDCVNLIDLSYCFSECNLINTDLPANLILYNTQIDDCERMFANCSSMSGDGTAFVELAELYGVTKHPQCFLNCASLPDYALIPSDWK